MAVLAFFAFSGIAFKGSLDKNKIELAVIVEAIKLNGNIVIVRLLFKVYH